MGAREGGREGGSPADRRFVNNVSPPPPPPHWRLLQWRLRRDSDITTAAATACSHSRSLIEIETRDTGERRGGRREEGADDDIDLHFIPRRLLSIEEEERRGEERRRRD